MSVKHPFFWGVVAGVGGTWAYHAFFRRLPSAKS
jgi:hypothetical protein